MRYYRPRYKSSSLEKKNEWKLSEMRAVKLQTVLDMIKSHLSSMDKTLKMVNAEEAINQLETDEAMLLKVASSDEDEEAIADMMEARAIYANALMRFTKATEKMIKFLESALKEGKVLGY